MLRDSVTNRTGPVNAKLTTDFVIIGEELRVGHVIFLEDHCEGPVADYTTPDHVAVASNSVQGKCLELKIQPRDLVYGIASLTN
jgi:hypothetical protein